MNPFCHDSNPFIGFAASSLLILLSDVIGVTRREVPAPTAFARQPRHIRNTRKYLHNPLMENVMNDFHGQNGV
jgi:hypothetical protein